MSPEISAVLQVTIMLVSSGAFFCGADDIAKSTPRRKRRTNLTIMALAGLGVFLVILYYFNQKQTPTTPSFAKANSAVLATVKEGDLILCTDPETNQVRYALLVESSAPQGSKVILHGNFLNRQSLFQTNGGIYTSYFDKCRVEAFLDDGLGSVDRKIGNIIRSGLNPPPPPK